MIFYDFWRLLSLFEDSSHFFRRFPLEIPFGDSPLWHHNVYIINPNIKYKFECQKKYIYKRIIKNH